MATYQELRQASEDGPLLIKVQVACIVAANTIAVELDTVPLHTQRLKWAASAFADPISTAREMIWSVLAKNAAATPAQITGASDVTVQTNVDASVNVFASTMG
jgi:hypothetical protein